MSTAAIAFPNGSSRRPGLALALGISLGIHALAIGPLIFLGGKAGTKTASLTKAVVRPSEVKSEASSGIAMDIAAWVYGVALVAFFIMHILFLAWVARDAKSRGMGTAILWMLLAFFMPFVGLLIYLFARTSGTLVSCSTCRHARLQFARVCPHCGNA